MKNNKNYFHGKEVKLIQIWQEQLELSEKFSNKLKNAWRSFTIVWEFQFDLARSYQRATCSLMLKMKFSENL